MLSRQLDRGVLKANAIFQEELAKLGNSEAGSYQTATSQNVGAPVPPPPPPPL